MLHALLIIAVAPNAQVEEVIVLERPVIVIDASEPISLGWSEPNYDIIGTVMGEAQIAQALASADMKVEYPDPYDPFDDFDLDALVQAIIEPPVKLPEPASIPAFPPRLTARDMLSKHGRNTGTNARGPRRATHKQNVF